MSLTPLEPPVLPPPPHDPRDRERLFALGAWEVRLSTGRAFEYFAPRGLLHAQLWSPRTGLSILTPCRLTADEFGAFPSYGWKKRCATYPELRELLAPEHATELLSLEAIHWVQGLVARIASAPCALTS